MSFLIDGFIFKVLILLLKSLFLFSILFFFLYSPFTCLKVRLKWLALLLFIGIPNLTKSPKYNQIQAP